MEETDCETSSQTNIIKESETLQIIKQYIFIILAFAYLILVISSDIRLLIRWKKGTLKEENKKAFNGINDLISIVPEETRRKIISVMYALFVGIMFLIVLAIWYTGTAFQSPLIDKLNITFILTWLLFTGFNLITEPTLANPEKKMNKFDIGLTVAGNLAQYSLLIASIVIGIQTLM